MAEFNLTLLIEQLKAVLADPSVPPAQRQEIIQLSRKTAVVLENPFEMFQRLAYSVYTPQSTHYLQGTFRLTRKS